MSKVDWSKAPEGTTHRNPREQRVESSWRRVEEDQVHWPDCHGVWQHLCDWDDELSYYEVRPVTPNPLRIPADIVPPPGATRVALVWYSTVDGQAVVHQPNPEQGVINLIGEQPAPEWNGTGQPPIGTVCLCNFSNGSRKVEVIGHRGGHCWVYMPEDKDYATIRDMRRFEPYLTEDQKIAKARKEDIDEICRDVQDALEPYNASIDCSVAMRATIEALYDKGYFEGDRE